MILYLCSGKDILFDVATSAGFEPATCPLGGGCSIQLSHEAAGRPGGTGPRSFGGNLAIVTQTIPALDEIYGENTRRSLKGGAGVKLYLTPSEQKTIEELSQAVGKTTKRVVTCSRAVGRTPFEGRSVSERTEDTRF